MVCDLFPDSMDMFAKKKTRVLSGSPWGAGTYAAADGSRQPTALELEIAEIQGRTFYQHVAKLRK